MNYSNELITKLRKAASKAEVAELLKAEGQDETLAERIWKELGAKREQDGQALSLDELEAISGGADRDWLEDGCAATVEPGSTCSSNDACWYWDVEYAHEPKEICQRCGGYMYKEYRYTVLGSTVDHYKCNKCGREKDVL